MASSPSTSWQIDGETVADFIFGGSKITADGDCSHEIKRCILLGRKVMTNLDSILKSRGIHVNVWQKPLQYCNVISLQLIKKNEKKVQRHYFINKDLSSQGYDFSSSHIWIWELDYKESWGSKNWCFWTVVLEKTRESLLDCKEIQPVHPKGDQCWVFTGRTDVEDETPILWPPDAKSWHIWKDPYAGKDWGQEEKGVTEDEMVGWHHQLNGHEFG